jgi:DNA-binding response OmpR family regulator
VYKVLLVDDEVSIRKLTARLLVSMGYSVIEAPSPFEALALIDESVDLVITDWDMGDTSGIDLIHVIRGGVEEWYKAMPVLMITGRGEADAEVAIEAGASAVLHKPFTMDELKAALKAVHR